MDCFSLVVVAAAFCFSSSSISFSTVCCFAFSFSASGEEYESVEDIVSATEDVLDDSKHGRWYDLDSTLRTAITLLQNCPESTRKVIAKQMAKNVIETIKKEDQDDVDDVEIEIPEV